MKKFIFLLLIFAGLGSSSFADSWATCYNACGTDDSDPNVKACHQDCAKLLS